MSMKTLSLSKREKEVCILLKTTGASNKELAYKLGIKEDTVKVYIRTIRKIFQAKNRTHIVVKLYQEPWLLDELYNPQFNEGECKLRSTVHVRK